MQCYKLSNTWTAERTRPLLESGFYIYTWDRLELNSNPMYVSMNSSLKRAGFLFGPQTISPIATYTLSHTIHTHTHSSVLSDECAVCCMRWKSMLSRWQVSSCWINSPLTGVLSTASRVSLLCMSAQETQRVRSLNNSVCSTLWHASTLTFTPKDVPQFMMTDKLCALFLLCQSNVTPPLMSLNCTQTVKSEQPLHQSFVWSSDMLILKSWQMWYLLFHHRLFDTLNHFQHIQVQN